jgi:hypothetical protein
VNQYAAIEHSPAEPEPNGSLSSRPGCLLLLRGIAGIAPHPGDTMARNFPAVRRFRTIVSQSTRAPEEDARRYVETEEHFWVVVKKVSLFLCSGSLVLCFLSIAVFSLIPPKEYGRDG